ncbi:PAP/25A-associated [Cordyceps militaris CM01]|uniref:polynucleotide adenylyltransferase n=1 Tax=Cordyceps militaris (strain CM01) TaxID=983644 RepID=G3JI53_CORMM|nr:PAP/25A-associated [Cordyceps militaris CM01]EGX91006.1 PAP/25A-associated [Cordyceps militaris CM01]
MLDKAILTTLTSTPSRRLASPFCHTAICFFFWLQRPSFHSLNAQRSPFDSDTLAPSCLGPSGLPITSRWFRRVPEFDDPGRCVALALFAIAYSYPFRGRVWRRDLSITLWSSCPLLCNCHLDAILPDGLLLVAAYHPPLLPANDPTWACILHGHQDIDVWNTPATTPSTSGTTDRPQEASAAQTAPFQTRLEYLPLWIPQQSNIYHAQLLHYNKLISPARGGGLQTPPLPPVVTSPSVQAAPRSRTSSRASLKDPTPAKSTASSGNGNRPSQNSENNRLVITSQDAPAKMPAKTPAESSKNWAQRAATLSTSPHGQAHSSSVPSTPHQHARLFSFESRDPSPNAGTNHSPRSAYSETNSTLPSLRPLPPRHGGCKYETAQINSRRRIPYSVGSDRLEKLDLRTVAPKLGEDEEQKLTKDMNEMYDKLLPTDKVEGNRKRLVQRLEKIFNDEWPGHDIKVHLFGSSGNLLCSDSSDVDICITTPWHEMEGVCMIADLLARRGMEKVVCISAAKVPIVKIWDPKLGLACDMNVNNTVALENTRMVRTYVEADPRVRKLAMIIKYWTRRRIVNDAAFGGTLSSYTVQKPDGSVGDFADNMKKIKGYGNKNKSSEAELLFQFFRFYAHEFDYDKHVLSVRLGRILTKSDKKWNYSMNNQLCVEEPFNTLRNLGNTVDEYSFRGLHLELRRAFDLISQGKLPEACEQFVFPKEEERVWSRPAAQPRPVLVRSSSQSHSGRGGRGNNRGNRHNNNFRGGGSNRRASSSVPAPYDGTMFIAPVNMAQDLSWYQNPQFPFQYAQQDLVTQMAYQQQFLYANSSAFLQHQNIAQQQQRMSGNASAGQPASDRSRTNSFDTAPTSAPIYAMYNMGLGHAFYQPVAQGYGTYPSSPVTTSHSTHDFRRSLHRSATAEAGTIPSFISDDTDFDETPKATAESPTSDDAQSGGFFMARSLSPTKQRANQQTVASGIAFGDLASASTGQRRLSTEQLPQTLLDRRMRRVSRSPSPLGHVRAHSVGTSSAPLPSAPFSGNRDKDNSRPLVVNGSSGKAANYHAAPFIPNPDFTPPTGLGLENALQIQPPAINMPIAPHPASVGLMGTVHMQPFQDYSPIVANGSGKSSKLPPADDTSFRERIASMHPYYPGFAGPPQDGNLHALGANANVTAGSKGSGSGRQRVASRTTSSGLIAPLDLATGDNRLNKASMIDMAHLSPVYETRTPSPTMHRKNDSGSTNEIPLRPKYGGGVEAKKSPVSEKHPPGQDNQKGKNQKANLPAQRSNPPRENGHVRAAKSESDGGWQKAGRRKKAPSGLNVSGHSEQPPKHESERKGG